MLTTGERATAHEMAEELAADPKAGDLWRKMARALLEATARELLYEKRIAELKDGLEAVTRSGVENATRYAAQLGESERVGQERIRAALLDGAADAEQAWATTEAVENVDCSSHSGTLYKMSRAYLALSASHAEARALLSDISARARALLGTAGT